MNKKKVSKLMCLILRHDPSKFGLEVDERGWSEVNPMIESISTKLKDRVSRSIIEQVVSEDNKGRFELSYDKKKIRCLHGHSLDHVSIELEEQYPANGFLLHGTATKSLDSIMKKGLLPLKRKYVHLTDSIDMAKSVGSRYDSNPVILKIDTEAMQKDGLKIFRSGSDVWLTENVSPKYIKIEQWT